MNWIAAVFIVVPAIFLAWASIERAANRRQEERYRTAWIQRNSRGFK